MLKTLLLLTIIFVNIGHTKTYLIRAVIDAENEYTSKILFQLRNELNEISDNETKFKLSTSVITLTPSTRRNINILNKKISQSSAKAFVLLGYRASRLADKIKPTKKVIVAPFLTKKIKTKRRNIISIVSIFKITSTKEELDKIQKFSNAYFINSTLDLNEHQDYLNRVKKTFQSKGIKLNYKFISRPDQIDKFIEDQKPQIIYISELDRFNENKRRRILKRINEQKIPTIVLNGRRLVEEGALIGLFSNINELDYILRKVALNVYRSNNGEVPRTLSETFTRDQKPIINLATAKAIDYSPAINFMLKAETIGNTYSNNIKRITFLSAIQIAIRNNPDLASERKKYESQKHLKDQATNAYLPQIVASLSSRKINKEQALFNQSENISQGTIGLQQVIYDNEVFGSLKSADLGYEIYAERLNQTQLDLVRDTAKAYLNILRAKIQQDIEERNFKNTEINLELAKARFKSGSSPSSDVYRWEISLQSSKRDYVNSSTNIHKAYIALNKLLNFKTTARYETDKMELKDRKKFKLLTKLVSKSSSIENIRGITNTLLKVANEKSPNLISASKNEQLAENEYSVKTRAFFLPTIAVNLEANRVFDRSGQNDKPVGIADDNWSASVNLTYPIFEGGGKYSRYKEEQRKYLGSKYTRKATYNFYATNINSRLVDVITLHQTIKLNEKSVFFAKKNFSAVKNRYSQGKATVIDFIDSQTSLRNTESVYIDSVYSLLDKHVELQNLIGIYDFLETSEKLNKIYNF